MWVYQEPSSVSSAESSEALTASAAGPETGESAFPPLPEQLPAEKAQPQSPESVPEAAEKPLEPVRKRTAISASRDCILLAGAYLFGTFLSGILSVLCDTGEMEALGYYLDCWRSSFAVSSAAEVAGLFRAEFLTASAALTILLLLGLSAIGSLPIFCFMMLYGAGAGMLSFQLLANVKLRALLAYCIASGIPTALAAGCLCLFGAAALQISGKLQRCSFGKALYPAGAWGLVGQFVRMLFLLLPICGAATGMLYFCGQMQLL